MTDRHDHGGGTCVPTGLAQVEAHLRRQLRGLVFDFQMIAADAGVVLLGRSFSYYAKQLAQHAVMEAVELPILANHIEVQAAGRL